jgi:hypothetical protein
MIREIVSKPFNIDDPTPVDVVVETYDNGAVVEYPLPSPRLVLSVDKPQIIADNVDSATITASFESCSLVDNELVWSKVVPTGDVVFTINLRPTTVTINAQGNAILAFKTNVPAKYQIKATFSGYVDVLGGLEALA